MKKKYSAESSLKLLKKYKNDMEKESFNRFYVTCHDYIRKIAQSVINDYETSEDITQEVFEKIVKLKKNQIPDKNILGWLYTITKNTAIDHIRKNSKITKVKLTENIHDTKANSEEKITDNEIYDLVISKLNEDEREVISLKIGANFTFKEISRMLGWSTAKVRYTYYKAINRLRLIITNFLVGIICVGIYGILINNIPKNIKVILEILNTLTNIDIWIFSSYLILTIGIAFILIAIILAITFLKTKKGGIK